MALQLYLLLRYSNTNKVNRCLARYSPRATTTNQPTNRTPNESAGPIYVPKTAYFGAKNGPFRPNILMILGGSKISCSGWKRRMKKVVWREEWQGIEAMKCTRWTWLLYRTLWNNFQYVWKKIWYPHIGKQKSAILTPKVWYLRPKGNFWFWNHDFSWKGHITNTRLGLPGKKFRLWGRGHFPGPWPTKLGGIFRATKKMTHIDNRLGPGWNYRETGVFSFCQKAENGQNIRFPPQKITRIPLRGWYINFGKGYFFFAHLCPVVATTWFRSRSGCFFGLKLWILALSKTVGLIFRLFVSELRPFS